MCVQKGKKFSSAILKRQRPESDKIRVLQKISASLTKQINQLTFKMDDAEGRSRRTNLIYYGRSDRGSELCADREAAIIKFFRVMLDVTIASQNI